MRIFKSKASDGDQPDQWLIDSYRENGDVTHIAELFTRYTGLVFGVCMKYVKDEELARDLTMQVYEVLCDKLKTHDVKHFSSWLHRVTSNHCLMHLRKEQTQRKRKDEFKYVQEQVVELEPDWHLDNEKEKYLQALEEALAVLNPEQQHCIRLFYLKDLSYQDICEETGLTFNEVKSHIQNGKRNLKLKLQHLMDDET